VPVTLPTALFTMPAILPITPVMSASTSGCTTYLNAASGMQFLALPRQRRRKAGTNVQAGTVFRC
jgi:hypothetical protein